MVRLSPTINVKMSPPASEMVTPPTNRSVKGASNSLMSPTMKKSTTKHSVGKKNRNVQGESLSFTMQKETNGVIVEKFKAYQTRFIFAGATCSQFTDFGYINNKTILVFDTADKELRAETLGHITPDLSRAADKELLIQIKDAIDNYMEKCTKTRGGVVCSVIFYRLKY